MLFARTRSRRIPIRLVAIALALGAVSTHAASSGTVRIATAANKTVPIVIDGATFSPADVTANVGDTVEWTNKDIVDHSATAQHGEWHVLIKAGKTGTLAVKKAGSFDYYCEFHPNMTGHLVVKPAAVLPLASAH